MMTRPSAPSRVSTCATLRLAPISPSGNTPFLFAPKLHNAVGPDVKFWKPRTTFEDIPLLHPKTHSAVGRLGPDDFCSGILFLMLLRRPDKISGPCEDPF